MTYIREYSPLIVGIIACCLTVYLLGIIENDTSCILVMQQLARDLTDDMNNRLASMQMKCIKVKGENYKHKEIDKLPLFKPSNNKEVEDENF